MAGLGDDLHDVAVAELIPKWDDAPVHLSSYASVTDFRVDVVREVDASRVARQDYDFALRRERVNLFRIEVDFESREKFVGIGDVALPLDDLSEPGKALFVLGVDRTAVFVFPVRGDSVF